MPRYFCEAFFLGKAKGVPGVIARDRADGVRSQVADLSRAEYDQTMDNPTRQEVDAKLAASEANLNARLANFDSSIRTGFAELRTEMARQHGDFSNEMASLRSELHKNTADLLKWGAGIALTSVAATVGLLTYINKTSVEKLSLAAPTPIVIYAQPQPAAPSQPNTPAR